MDLTLNYNKIGVIINALFIIIICVLLIISIPNTCSNSTGSTEYVERELDRVFQEQLDRSLENQRSIMDAIHRQGQVIDSIRELNSSLGSEITYLRGRELRSGDLLIESGVTIDEHFLILGEIERRLR